MLGLRKQNRRKSPQGDRRLPRIEWRRLFTLAAFFAVAAAVGYGLIAVLDRPVRAIAVEGPFQRVSPVQIDQAVAGMSKAGFLSMDLERVRHSVEALPWVDRARVQRRWPNGLRVEITEQTAAARWGESGLLNTRGELFIRDARHMPPEPPELPQLSGPEGSEWQVAQRYLSVQGQLIEAGTRLISLQLDARGAWRMELANGIAVRLGRGRQVDQRLDRFIHTALPMLAIRAAEVAYVDMRYTNGFAVGWKTSKGLTHGKEPTRVGLAEQKLQRKHG